MRPARRSASYREELIVDLPARKSACLLSLHAGRHALRPPWHLH
jgi:hypothetical protein